MGVTAFIAVTSHLIYIRLVYHFAIRLLAFLLAFLIDLSIRSLFILTTSLNYHRLKKSFRYDTNQLYNYGGGSLGPKLLTVFVDVIVKSRTGLVISVGRGGAVCADYRKQSSHPLSTTEAELYKVRDD